MAAWYGFVYIASSAFSKLEFHPSGLNVQNLPTAGIKLSQQAQPRGSHSYEFRFC